MITNLVCSVVVSLVTNVSVTDNHVGCSVWQSIADNNFAFYHPYHEGCGPWKAPTERTNVVKVLRVTTVGFRWNGKDWVCRDEEVVSETKTEEVLESAWKKR